jgi:hypothetical protein
VGRELEVDLLNVLVIIDRPRMIAEAVQRVDSISAIRALSGVKLVQKLRHISVVAYPKLRLL